MAGLVYVVALAWSFVPPPADGVAFPLWAHVETARGVLAIERAMNHRLPANPTAADLAKQDAIREAGYEAAMNDRLNRWAMRRIVFEANWAREAAVSAKGTPRAARERERAKYLSVLGSNVNNPK